MVWSPSRIVGNYLVMVLLYVYGKIFIILNILKVYHEIMARANSRANQRRRPHRHSDATINPAGDPNAFCTIPFDTANSEQKDAPKPGGLWKRVCCYIILKPLT